jgi:AraC-like DNA-binding protein
MVRYTNYADLEVFEGELTRHHYPWHFHPCYTIVLVGTGSILYELKDRCIRVGPSEVLVIGPYQVHRNSIERPTRYQALFLPTAHVEQLGPLPLRTGKVEHPQVMDRTVQLLHRLRTDPGSAASAKAIRGYCRFLYPTRSEHGDEEGAALRPPPPMDLAKRIDDLAQDAHVSPFHFQRKFKKEHGLTIGQLKQQAASVKAKALLEEGRSPIDTAYEVGYFDQSHFIKYFKRMWATTPGRFFKAHFFTIPVLWLL